MPKPHELAAMSGYKLLSLINDCRTQLATLGRLPSPLKGATATRYRYYTETLRAAIDEQKRRGGGAP